MAAPIPREPPVTSATLPANCPFEKVKFAPFNCILCSFQTGHACLANQQARSVCEWLTTDHGSAALLRQDATCHVKNSSWSASVVRAKMSQ
jgi:hypothetical protein